MSVCSDGNSDYHFSDTLNVVKDKKYEIKSCLSLHRNNSYRRPEYTRLSLSGSTMQAKESPWTSLSTMFGNMAAIFYGRETVSYISTMSTIQWALPNAGYGVADISYLNGNYGIYLSLSMGNAIRSGQM
jgi:hypothetical protein